MDEASLTHGHDDPRAARSFPERVSLGRVNLARVNLARVILALSALTAVGCSGKSDLVVLQPVQRALGAYHTVAVDVVTDVEDSAAARKRLETHALNALRQSRVFKRVIRRSRDPERKADLDLELRVTRCDELSKFWSSVLGGLTPRAKITIEGTCVEVLSGENVGSFSAEGQSARGIVYSDGMEQAIVAAVGRIARFVQLHE